MCNKPPDKEGRKIGYCLFLFCFVLNVIVSSDLTAVGLSLALHTLCDGPAQLNRQSCVKFVQQAFLRFLLLNYKEEDTRAFRGLKGQGFGGLGREALGTFPPEVRSRQ